MEDHESDKFSWTGLFMVTALCSIVFNVAVKILDHFYSPLLFIIAAITAIAGILCWAVQFILLYYAKKRKSRLVS
jgi:uncharacterized membrane protein YGL010W